jgi:hypothetical protein
MVGMVVSSGGLTRRSASPVPAPIIVLALIDDIPRPAVARALAGSQPMEDLAVECVVRGYVGNNTNFCVGQPAESRMLLQTAFALLPRIGFRQKSISRPVDRTVQMPHRLAVCLRDELDDDIPVGCDESVGQPTVQIRRNGLCQTLESRGVDSSFPQGSLLVASQVGLMRRTIAPLVSDPEWRSR